MLSDYQTQTQKLHLDLNGPGEVTDVDEEGDVGVAAEIKLLIGEAILELLQVATGDDGDLLSCLSTSWRTRARESDRERESERADESVLNVFNE